MLEDYFGHWIGPIYDASPHHRWESDGLLNVPGQAWYNEMEFSISTILRGYIDDTIE
jgi:hypothetical protein